MTELKPCPFCGAKDITARDNPRDPDNASEAIGPASVHCSSCGGIFGDWIDEAIAAWNRRPSPSISEGEVEALLSGKSAVLAHTKEHAQNLYTVALACLKSHGVDPEADLVAAEARCKRLEEALRQVVAADTRAAYRGLATAPDQMEIGPAGEIARLALQENEP